MTTTNETRIEVEQTAEAREAAIRDLTEHDQIVYRTYATPEGRTAESDLYVDEDGDLFAVGLGVIRWNDCGPVVSWRGVEPGFVLLAVIKREPPFDPKPGDVWGEVGTSALRVVYLPGAWESDNPWLGVVPPSRATWWHSSGDVRRAIRAYGWVKLYEGGQEVPR